MVWTDAVELDSFRAVCQFDALTSVNFQSCEFPAPSDLDSFLSPFTQLEYVQLTAITFRGASHDQLYETALNSKRRSRLRRIDSSVETFHDWALHSQNLAYMKELCTLRVSDLHTENFAHIEEILRVTSGSLEELALVAITELDLHALHVVDIGAIRRLKLHDGTKALARSGRPMAWISPLMSKISKINELEEVEYMVGSPLGSPMRPNAIPSHFNAEWSELDRVLTDHKFSRLGRFHISFDSEGGDFEAFPPAGKASDRLPLLIVRFLVCGRYRDVLFTVFIFAEVGALGELTELLIAALNKAPASTTLHFKWLPFPTSFAGQIGLIFNTPASPPLATMGQKVPYELSDCIIGNLRDDLDALKQCSLVCRSWLPSSRLYIHRKIKLAIWDDKACARKFRNMYQFLLYSPHIASYTREISLEFLELSWRSLDEFALRSLKLLPALTCIQMHRMTWNTVGDLDSFLNSCHLEFLTAIELHSCRFPSLASLDACLGALPRLQSLHLSEPRFRCDQNDPLPRNEGVRGSAHRRIHLRSLNSSIASLCDWFSRPFTMISIESLRSLSLEHMQRPDFAKMEQLLRQANGSVEEVTLKVIGVGAGTLPTVDVTNVHRLRLCDQSPKLSMPPEWILELLVQLRSVECLEEIVLVVLLGGAKPPLLHSSDGWTRLDDILADPKFRPIRRFSVSCQPSHFATGVREYLEAGVGRGMPKLDGRGHFQTSGCSSIICQSPGSSLHTVSKLNDDRGCYALKTQQRLDARISFLLTPFKRSARLYINQPIPRTTFLILLVPELLK
ncbi:hypothetical protein BD779DRAFT_1474109 [Infundibulicybe gibba]|nr:hypothetical protein BD779DRAFT_1474109 [Infundibulicybe gibba]